MMDDPTAEMPPVRIGVLGCASIARRRTIPAMLVRPSIELVAVASRDAAKAIQFARDFDTEPVTGYEALLRRDDLDAVYLPLPVTLHPEWAERALRAGLHVLCEKPLAPREQDAAALVRLADERSLVLMENLMFVRHGQHRYVRELLDAGEIGEVRGVTADFGFPPKPADDMRYSPVGGGAMIEIGIYPTRTAMMVLGRDLSVVGATARRDPVRGVELSGAALLQAPDGTPAHLTWGMEHAYRSAYEIWGTTGRIAVDWAYTPTATHPPVIRISRDTGEERRILPAEDQFGAVLDAFVRAVRTGEPDPELQGEAVTRTAALLDKIQSACTTATCGPVSRAG